ncbi:BRCA2, oligonucleotide/oligosaccharide-binding, domain 1-domain-containing protein [Dichotomocladium elegans]|nr:BRCA2, oligonucleotide/oligosaccharide-binding, domain 1-domain-containing protein [Dichotomocladium elegans]
MEASGPRMSLKSFGEPGIYTRNQLLAMNIPSAAVDMTAAAAKDHRFYGWGPQEARKAMIRAGALEKFIPLAWVENHYRWIVWKIAGMIRSFPRHLKDWWSPKKILDQLLYRYEREINLGHRSALKRIIEQDDVPGKLMILVIVDITKGHASESNQSHDSKKYELLLSDGWYQVTAVADTRLERAISRGRLTIGYKLAICGAQTNVFPRAPTSTSTPGNTVLTIASNGCRIAPWDAKLGYQRRRLEYRSLNSLHNDGGVVTAIDVIVCRKYPIMYSETLSDGSVVVRTAREEEEARREALSRLCGYGNDDWAPSFSEHSQSVISQQYSKLLEDRHAPTPIANEERKVSGYFRVRVCDIPAGGNKPKTTATLLQLDANEVLHMDICEGGRYRIYFLAPYLPRSKRYPGLNLKSTRKIHWEPVIKRCGTAEFSAPSLYIPRHITTCDKIPHDISEEVDMVVVVLCVTSTEKRRQPSGKIIWYQKLLVSDESKALVQVTIRLTSRPLSHPEGQVIAFTNAQFEMHDAKYEVTHMRISEESEIIIRPFSSAEYLQKAISSLREWVQKYPENVESLRQHINEKLLHH